MKALVEAFPQHLVEALEIGKSFQFSNTTNSFENVVISGLGGSGIGGKIVSQLVSDSCCLPIICTNDYSLPAFVGAKTLVIISSYSGETEETVAAYLEAKQKGATISCITSGGKIANMAQADGYNCVMIPGGNPPRSMFGYSSVQVLFTLKAFGIYNGDFTSELTSTIALLNTEKDQLRRDSRNLAEKIVDRIPVLYSEANYEGVAIRWRQQINENSKMLCWHHVFPEMNHNELVGWTGGDNRVAVVLLRAEDDHRRSQIRMEICKKLMLEKCDTLIEVWAKGASRLERAYYLIHFGDWLSIDLAEIKNEDATAIPAIIFLKNELSKI
jgi:glucose/mannose-6-phosphate isomerase